MPLYGFRRALLGEPQDSPNVELDAAKYPSLVILRCYEHDARGNADAVRKKSKFRVAMNAEDILKFMLSDFAKSHSPPRACLSPSSPRKMFAAACVERMRDLEQNLRESAALENAENNSHKRRRLAIATVCQMTRVLFDANKMVLDALL
jgi:hypothetical protein